MKDMIAFPHLGIFFPHVIKSFSLFGTEIAMYGIILAAAMIAGIRVAMTVAKKTGQDEDMYFSFALIAIVCSVLGARAYYVIFSWDYYREYPEEILNLRGGGLAIYGGVIAGILTAAVFSAVKKVRLSELLDTAVTGMITGQAIGRWGNFFNREAFGEYTDSLLAMQLPVDAVKSSDITVKMKENLSAVNGIACIQVHPAFLYESLWNFGILFVLLLVSLKKRNRFHGEVFCLYLLGYGLGRLWIEGLRTDQLLLPGTSWPVSQILSGILAAAGLTGLLIGRIKKKRYVRR